MCLSLQLQAKAVCTILECYKMVYEAKDEIIILRELKRLASASVIPAYRRRIRQLRIRITICWRVIESARDHTGIVSFSHIDD